VSSGSTADNHSDKSTAGTTGDEYCNPKSYCLGYTSLFNPLRPILTDLLFAAVASANPGAQFRYAIEQMQGFKYQLGYPGIYELPEKLRKKAAKQEKKPPNKALASPVAIVCRPLIGPA
jgi:hypothetical protein